MLWEFLLGGGRNLHRSIKHNRPTGGGSLINRKNMAHLCPLIVLVPGQNRLVAPAFQALLA